MNGINTIYMNAKWRQPFSSLMVRTLTMDSPYVYAVVDLPSQTPLFLGIVDEPI